MSLRLAITNNNFVNNAVKLIVALGEKKQEALNNAVTNSGEFKTEQNLKLKMMY